MRFRVYSTRYCDDCRKDFDKLVNDYPILTRLDITEETVEKQIYRGGTKEATVLTIKIDSIEQLMTLVRASDRGISNREFVIGDTDCYGMPYIEIYDDYRE